MRLFEIYSNTYRRLNESGSVQGTGPIAQQEIEPTLKALEQSLGLDLSYSLGSAARNKTGSFGKKTFSGDIDVAVESDPNLLDKLQSSPMIQDVNRTSEVYSTKVQIANYDANLESPDPSRPRTGYVQVDFMPTENKDWAVLYWHSPHEGDSDYKGVYRTVLLSTLASFIDRKQSPETIPDGRPEWLEKWTLSSQGLRRQRITPKPAKKGGYTKANNAEQIKTITDPDQALKILGLTRDDIDSYESLITAIRNKHKDIAAAVIDSYKNSRSLQDFGGAPKDL